MQFEVHGYKFDTEVLPAKTLGAFLVAGATHKLGNECAARASAWGKEVVDKDGKVTVPAKSDEEKAAFKKECQDEMYANALAGTLGISTRGPSRDPLVVEMESIARDEVASIFRSMNLKMPKGDETVAIGKITGTAREWIARRLAGVDTKGVFGKPGEPNRPRIEREANKRLAEKAKKAQKVAESIDANSVEADELGL